MQITFATKMIDGGYEVALLVDNQFKRSGAGKDVLALLQKLAGPIITSASGEGTEIVVNMGIHSGAEVARLEARRERERQTQEAEAEAKEIEALTAAVKHEADARVAAMAAVATETASLDPVAE
jgi:hypothetical protein